MTSSSDLPEEERRTRLGQVPTASAEEPTDAPEERGGGSSLAPRSVSSPEPDPVPETPSEPADEPAPAASPAREPHVSRFEPYTIGDPGKAFTRTVPHPDVEHGDTHDFVIDAATISDPQGRPRLLMRAASARGLSHQHYGDPRQDDHCFGISDDGEYVVGVVADGVSSGIWSHFAARAVTEEGAKLVSNLLLTEAPEEIDWRGVFLELSQHMCDVCATLPSKEPTVDLTPRDVAARMATTIVFGVVAIRPDEKGVHAVTVVRLGDTSAWILDDEDGWISLGDVKNAGNVIAESATASLPLVPDEDPLIVQTTLAHGAALLLITDGIGDPLGSGRGEVGAELARWWATPPHPLEFAAQVSFGRKSFDDDRGAMGFWPVGPE